MCANKVLMAYRIDLVSRAAGSRLQKLPQRHSHLSPPVLDDGRFAVRVANHRVHQWRVGFFKGHIYARLLLQIYSRSFYGQGNVKGISLPRFFLGHRKENCFCEPHLHSATEKSVRVSVNQGQKRMAALNCILKKHCLLSLGFALGLK